MYIYRASLLNLNKIKLNITSLQIPLVWLGVITIFVVIKKALFSDGGIIRSDVSQTLWYIGGMLREDVSVNATPKM